MMTATLIVIAVAFGVGAFLWGQLTVRNTCTARRELAYLDGFRDGWESAVRLESDVKVIWGDRR
jgi:hypothetical protein